VKSPKVRLYIRIRRPDGRTSFLDRVWNRNRTLRQSYALDGDQPKYHPTGCYYLRFRRGGKSVWESIAPDGDAAVVALRNKQHDLECMALGRNADLLIAGPTSSLNIEVSPLPSVSLASAISVYLDEIQRFRSPKTLAACTQMLESFQKRLPGKLIKDITRKDLLDHMTALKGTGKGDRTVYNHIMRIVTFLKANEIVGLLRAADNPSMTRKTFKPMTLINCVLFLRLLTQRSACSSSFSLEPAFEIRR